MGHGSGHGCGGAGRSGGRREASDRAFAGGAVSGIYDETEMVG